MGRRREPQNAMRSRHRFFLAVAAMWASGSLVLACGASDSPASGDLQTSAQDAAPETTGTAIDGAVASEDSGVAPGDAARAIPRGSTDAGAVGAREAGGTDAAAGDFGMPSSTYPAFAPDFGQIVNNNGYVMKSPIIVPITWNTDASQATFDAFTDALGASSYWQTIAKDYGVGPASSGSANHAHVAGTPPTILTETMDANSDLAKLVAANAGTSWPAPTKDTIYAFFLPPGTSLRLPTQMGGPATDACMQGIGGYHTSIPAAAGQADLAYAVVIACGGANAAVQEETLSMSHEIIETASDPFGGIGSSQNFGWFGFDGDHFAFEYFNELQAEIGDTCEFFREAFLMGDASFPYALQRIWSNSSALAGHHPCVPVPSGPYFNVTPLGLTAVNVTVPGSLTGGNAQTASTRGVRILNGTVGTFTVGFYSDGPTGVAWSITATAGNPILRGGGDFLGQMNPSSIVATIDKASGQNGEKAHVTVQVTTSGTAFHGELLTITSNLNAVRHYMPIWIAGE